MQCPNGDFSGVPGLPGLTNAVMQRPTVLEQPANQVYLENDHYSNICMTVCVCVCVCVHVLKYCQYSLSAGMNVSVTVIDLYGTW